MEPNTLPDTQPAPQKPHIRRRVWLWLVLVGILLALALVGILFIQHTAETPEDMYPLPDGFGLV